MTQPRDLTFTPPSFALHLVQLAGKPTLLGADHVTWRFGGMGIDVVAGGNGSGKTLLCSAIEAAFFPDVNESLRNGLYDAGLREVTVVGLMNSTRSEWTLVLETGEVICRPQGEGIGSRRTPILAIIHANEDSYGFTPHIVTNGQWRLPDADVLKWAARLSCVPLQREIAAWEARLESLEQGNGQKSPVELSTELEDIERQLADIHATQTALKAAEERALELNESIAECELAIQVAAAEETALVKKIELAERAVHLEGWVQELRTSWEAAETVRTTFSELNEQLEEVQSVVRNLPENADQLARDYLQLLDEFETLTSNLKELERTMETRQEQRSSLLRELAATEETIAAHELPDKESLTQDLLSVEQELTEISRKRIDLLRRKDALEHQRSDRYREFAALGEAEWLSLREYLRAVQADEQTSLDQRHHETVRELAEISQRLQRDFAGFEKLSKDTPGRIERLYSIRDAIAKRETELAALRAKVVEVQSQGTGEGLRFGLMTVGAMAAGIPAAFLLGWDVGFFGALLGGGAGYGIGKLISPRLDANYEDYVRRIESLQTEQNEALAAKETLRLELVRFPDHLGLHETLAIWNEFESLHGRKLELEARVAEVARHVPNQGLLPESFRRFEPAEVRERVAAFDQIQAELQNVTEQISAFDSPDGPGARREALDLEATQLRARLDEYELATARRAEEISKKRSQIQSMLADLEKEIALQPNLDELRMSARDIQARAEELDAAAGGTLRAQGAARVLNALEMRSVLQEKIREAKSRLSTLHSPQELAARTGLIEEELLEVSARLREIDPLFGTLESRGDALTKYRMQMTRLYDNRVESEKRIEELRREILDLDLPELRARAEELPAESLLLHNYKVVQTQIEELQKSIFAAQNMGAALRVELTEQFEQSESRVLGELKSLVFEALGERIASIEFDGGEWYVFTDNGTRRRLSTLPRGVIELVSLCLNSGILETVRDAERAPVVWDDVLSQLDDHHLSISRRVVESLSRDRQIILLTRDSRIRTWGRTAELLAGRHEPSIILN